jgi:N,N-dimethylformamidase
MKHDPEHLTGYTNRPKYLPGQWVPTKISARAAGQARLVRLRHGDTNPVGPGLLYDVVDAVPPVDFAAGHQQLRRGSWGVFALAGPTTVTAFTVTTWIWPTTTDRGTVMVLADNHHQIAVTIRNHALRITFNGRTWGLASESITVRARVWQFLSITIDLDAATAELTIIDGPTTDTRRVDIHPPAAAMTPTELVIAAQRHLDGTTTDHYNGKIEAPAVWPRAVGTHEMQRIAAGQMHAEALLQIDFSINQHSVAFTDIASGTTGELFGMPTRAVTGHRWRGQTHLWTDDPGLYSAVHFHEDDLSDAQWPTTLSLQLPLDLEPGFYAAWLRTTDHEDWITFVVGRAPNQPARPLCVLVPTLTYQAYANEPICPPHVPVRRDERDTWAAANGLLSQYNWHTDGSGVTHASWRRPMLNLRPDYRYWLTGHPHGPGADLYLLHWLDSIGLPYDLITDHDLHAVGDDAVSDYQTLVTGCHPEYWTRAMLSALEAFQDRGGRTAYLGGNGLAGLVAVHPEQPWVSEMRRRGGLSGLWDCDPGETAMAADGAYGGLTRHHHLRGRALVGVDMTGMGFGAAQPFQKQPDADNHRVAFLFDGVKDEIIGNFGLHMGGAAGYEVDAADHRSGTASHALVVASCTTLPTTYVEADQSGTPRADVVFYETPSGGAVFATGSITWTGSLSHQDGDNPIARITENMLRRFLDPKPFLFSRDLAARPADPLGSHPAPPQTPCG